MCLFSLGCVGVVDECIFSQTHPSLVSSQPDAALSHTFPSFSALSSLLSGFADQKAICSQPPPLLLVTSSHILSTPQHFPCFVLGFCLCFLASMGRGSVTALDFLKSPRHNACPEEHQASSTFRDPVPSICHCHITACGWLYSLA